MQKYRNILNFLAKTLDFLLLVCYNVIVDANNLSRNLFLAFDLIERSNKVIIAVNMASEVSSFSDARLEEKLNVPVVSIDARKKKSVQKLIDKISKVSKEKAIIKEETNKEISRSKHHSEFRKETSNAVAGTDDTYFLFLPGHTEGLHSPVSFLL